MHNAFSQYDEILLQERLTRAEKLFMRHEGELALIINVTKRDMVKYLISSRPSPIFLSTSVVIGVIGQLEENSSDLLKIPLKKHIDDDDYNQVLPGPPTLLNIFYITDPEASDYPVGVPRVEGLCLLIGNVRIKEYYLKLCEAQKSNYPLVDLWQYCQRLEYNLHFPEMEQVVEEKRTEIEQKFAALLGKAISVQEKGIIEIAQLAKRYSCDQDRLVEAAISALRAEIKKMLD